MRDRGDGSYGVSVVWDPAVTPVPGVVVQQPDRNPVPVTPPKPSAPTRPGEDCTDAARKLLECLGLDEPEVKRVRVKSVCLEVDLKEPLCRKAPDC